ncbi:ribonuclease M5 [Limosilactobacillus sp. STM2_1]|uniref:Ribonuclease M5 n=1 Tax=Limosilactobacillus rudii TaxID=2759755 RepID=A0A7W3YP90_9LACO|nr:ribonuclease M5 [Limosilactobacillus rudii]MBB1079018.1 ribonuclease M5 [Limosilactobacillus rudii]MBB1098296.1 ribonuclease M5 [Limosilactobacillus rudii]MCD7135304.1 ribonuclease M5 [Limosilactobacillus rudii]
MIRVKEVIVVEGKDDTKQILKAVDADTYETNGSAISQADLTKLAKLQKSRGLIVFTDPDFNGERIRKIISKAIPGVKHAFIKRKEGVPTEAHGSLGVEHAAPAVIEASLKRLYTQAPVQQKNFDNRDLQQAGLIGQADSRKRRERLGQILGIGYSNGKQLVHRLNMFQVDKNDFIKAVQQINQEEKHE